MFNLGFKFYDLLKASKANSLFSKKKIVMGKTHHLVSGSSHYPTWRCPNCKRKSGLNSDRTRYIVNTRNNNSKNEYETCHFCGTKVSFDDLKEHSFPSFPETTSSVSHVHFEYADMIVNFIRKGHLNDFLQGKVY